MQETYKLFIDGTWRESASGETIPAINPYNQEIHAWIPVATPQDVEDAVAAARKAFESVWSRTTPGDRARLLNRAAELIDADAERLALLETTDNGKV
ncbi:MAG: aldehyde dehydrogenase family protein, partial [Novosphingobium sp.]|nr:aldehyde dehydrogenase family protein [Novosphingobium sp.]